MPLSKLVFKPGINRDQTNYASEGGWYDCDKIRFRSGYPEKIGGWQVKTFTPYAGNAISLYAWNTLAGEEYIGVGTSEKMYINYGTALLDITPIRVTLTSPTTNNCFTTINGSRQVTVSISGHGASEGDWVTFSGVVGTAGFIGGIPEAEFNAEFKMTSVGAGVFTITLPSAATSVATGGGTAISAAIQVGIGGEVAVAGYGWGAGTWGRGGWGSGSTVPLYIQPRLIFQDRFNDDLIFNIRDGNIYYWENSLSNRAVLLSSIGGAVAVPQQVGKVMFAPSGHLLALGCTNYNAAGSAPEYLGTYDPLLVRWANVDSIIGPEPENWRPELTNNAGFLRLQSGTDIVASIRTRQEVLLITDTSVYSLQFLGTEEVFRAEELSAHISITGPNTLVGSNNISYWMGRDKFYVYSGRVDTLPCTLRQYVFEDINLDQSAVFFAGSNAQFNEVIWFYCSGSSNSIDRYVIYNYSENIWYFGQLNRTAWIDASVTDYPIAASNTWLYEHELGVDDGQPLDAPNLPIVSYIQSADVDIDDGDKFMLVRRVIPDVNFVGSTASSAEVELTVGVRNFPGAVNATTNASDVSTARNVSTATIDQYTNQVFVRCRGRQMNFRINSDTVGTQWQLGIPRVDARPDGGRS